MKLGIAMIVAMVLVIGCRGNWDGSAYKKPLVKRMQKGTNR